MRYFLVTYKERRGASDYTSYRSVVSEKMFSFKKFCMEEEQARGSEQIVILNIFEFQSEQDYQDFIA